MALPQRSIFAKLSQAPNFIHTCIFIGWQLRVLKSNAFQFLKALFGSNFKQKSCEN